MILDALRHTSRYSSRPAWKKAFEFLDSLPPDASDGKIPIEGDDIFAIVMSYTTRAPAEGILEAHRRYVDVQAVLSGRENCEWYPAGSLTTSDPYEEGRDAEFFEHPGFPPARFSLSPGFFAVFFPGDGHMTSLAAGGSPEPVKKVVVKIRADLLQP